MTFDRGQWFAEIKAREVEHNRLTEGLHQLRCGCWTDGGGTLHAFIQRTFTVNCENREGVAVHTLDVKAYTEAGAIRRARERLQDLGIRTAYEMRVAGHIAALKDCCPPKGTCSACQQRSDMPYCY